MTDENSTRDAPASGQQQRKVMPRYTFDGPTGFMGYWIKDEWMNEMVARADNHIIAERICSLLNQEQQTAA